MSVNRIKISTMRYNRKFALRAILCCLLLSPGISFASKVLEPLRLAVMDQTPYGIKGNDSTAASGIFVEFLQHIAGTAGYEAEISIVPVKRLGRAIMVGMVQCSIFQYNPGGYGNQYLHYQPTIIPWQIDSFAMIRTDKAITEVSQLVDYPIAIPRGMVIAPARFKGLPFKWVMTGDYRQSILMFKRGRIDALVGSGPSLRYILEMEPVTEAYATLELSRNPAALYCDKRNLSPETYQNLQRATQTFLATDTWRQIVEKYLPSSEPPPAISDSTRQ